MRPIRTVPRFSAAVNQLAPVQPTSGNEANADLKVAAGALDTVGDVFSRFLVTFGIGSGLRGGEFTYLLKPWGYEFDLKRVQWIDDLQVSGTMRWELASGDVTADLRLRQRQGRGHAGDFLERRAEECSRDAHRQRRRQGRQGEANRAVANGAALT